MTALRTIWMRALDRDDRITMEAVEREWAKLAAMNEFVRPSLPECDRPELDHE